MIYIIRIFSFFSPTVSSASLVVLFAKESTPTRWYTIIHWLEDETATQLCGDSLNAAETTGFTEPRLLLLAANWPWLPRGNRVNTAQQAPLVAQWKESTCQCRRPKRHWFDPWLLRIPGREKCKPPLLFLPGKSHGQRSLEGCSP